MKAIEQAALAGKPSADARVLSAVLATHRDTQPVSVSRSKHSSYAFPSPRPWPAKVQEQIATAVQATARRRRLLPFGLGAIGLSGGCGSGARKPVRSGAPPRAHPASARLPPWRPHRSCIARRLEPGRYDCGCRGRISEGQRRHRIEVGGRGGVLVRRFVPSPRGRSRRHQVSASWATSGSVLCGFKVPGTHRAILSFDADRRAGRDVSSLLLGYPETASIRFALSARR